MVMMKRGDKVLEVAEQNIGKYETAGYEVMKSNQTVSKKNTVEAQPTVVKAEESVESEEVVSDNDDNKGD